MPLVAELVRVHLPFIFILFPKSPRTHPVELKSQDKLKFHLTPKAASKTKSKSTASNLSAVKFKPGPSASSQRELSHKLQVKRELGRETQVERELKQAHHVERDPISARSSESPFTDEKQGTLSAESHKFRANHERKNCPPCGDLKGWHHELIKGYRRNEWDWDSANARLALSGASTVGLSGTRRQEWDSEITASDIVDGMPVDNK
ncbi:hypothetical protein B0H17DRAFT_1126801 [Mycena rosella]|uniref:Uncharacterized protein n=1 Tax=Mycena rosella TaxID=1033263 RepID=A0AAD7GST8_MYCRO|nr:hypothetical protein B0H17DRAFT_1126801 [Mycena rosella]